MRNGRSIFSARHFSWLFERGTATGLSDGELLERAVASHGDREAAETAFQVLVERHGPMVLRVCRCALGDVHDAEDAFQATFLTLAVKARTIWVKDSLGPWLHAVALRVTAKAKANIARRKLRERKAAEMAETHQDDGSKPDRDRATVLHEEVGRLPEKYRAPIVLCYLEGLTHEAAAQHLEWPVGTVRGRLARGRDLLRSRLQRRGLADPVALVVAAVATEAQARAAVPAALMKSTTHAAISLVAGAEASAVVSASVAELVREMRGFVLGPKLKSAMLAAVAVLTIGSGILASRSPVVLPDASPILRGHTSLVTSVAYSPDGSALASAGFDDTVRLWDVARRREIFRLPGVGIVTCVAFAPDGKTLASAGHSPLITLWDARAGQMIGAIATGQRKAKFTGIYDGVNALAFSSDGRRLAWALGPGAEENRYVRLWDRDAGREIPIPPIHEQSVISLAFSPDGRTLASGDWGGTVKVWDTAAGHLVQTLTGGMAESSSLAFSPDGETLACAGAFPDYPIRLWNVRGGWEVASLKGHRVAIGCVAFSPDGRILASGDKLGTVKLWNISNGAAATTDRAHTSPVASLDYSPDGRTLATGSWDETVRLWRVADLLAPKSSLSPGTASRPLASAR